MIKKCIGWAWYLLILAIAIIDGVNHDWVGMGVSLAALALLIAFAVDEEIERKRKRETAVRILANAKMSPEEVAELSAKLTTAVTAVHESLKPKPVKLVKEPTKRPGESFREYHQRIMPDCQICAERLREK